MATCARLRIMQQDERKEVTGPPKSVAFDAEGKATRAAESFAAKQGVPVASLYLVTTPKGEYLAAEQVSKGYPAAERLREILPRAIAEISWPRTMYWTGISGARFIRPIRWVVALLGGERLRFDVGDVSAGSVTRGHRFLGKAEIGVKGFADYAAKLRKNFVLVQPDERRRKIDRELTQLVSRKGLRVNEDSGLANLVTYLNEFPLGDFGRV